LMAVQSLLMSATAQLMAVQSLLMSATAQLMAVQSLLMSATAQLMAVQSLLMSATAHPHHSITFQETLILLFIQAMATNRSRSLKHDLADMGYISCFFDGAVPLNYILTYLCIYLLTYPLTHSPTQLLTHSPSYLLTHSLTHTFTPCSRVLLQKLTGSQLVKKFPAFYGS